MSENNRFRLIALGVTLVVHTAVIALLLLFRLSAVEPKVTPVQLTLINFGTTDEPMSGNIEPAAGNAQTEEPLAVPTRTERAPSEYPRRTSEELVTSPKSKASPASTSADFRLREAETIRLRERQARREAEVKKREAEQAQMIGNEMAGAFGRGQAKAKSQGSGGGESGNQGSVKGSGSSYALSGRSIIGNGGLLSRPAYAKAIRGTIRVTIIVDASGTVTNAWVDPSASDISDPAMRTSAVNAAKSTRFNAIPGGSSQRGAITYHYDIK